jgi:hypothetical protein
VSSVLLDDHVIESIADILRTKGLWAHEATSSSLSGLSIAVFTHGLG